MAATESLDNQNPDDRIVVRRSGGIAGVSQTAELRLDDSQAGQQVRQLLERVDLQAVAISTPQPDRFVYSVEYGSRRVTIGERDLNGELGEVVHLVLNQQT